MTVWNEITRFSVVKGLWMGPEFESLMWGFSVQLHNSKLWSHVLVLACWFVSDLFVCFNVLQMCLADDFQLVNVIQTAVCRLLRGYQNSKDFSWKFDSSWSCFCIFLSKMFPSAICSFIRIKKIFFLTNLWFFFKLQIQNFLLQITESIKFWLLNYLLNKNCYFIKSHFQISPIS